MNVSFCLEALEEAFTRYGQPEIFNTDQGSQFTSFDFTSALKDRGIKISMDGKGRWMDDVFIERLWRSLKYECVYLNILTMACRPGRTSPQTCPTKWDHLSGNIRV